MYSLILGPTAIDDINTLKKSGNQQDVSAAALIVAILEQIKADQGLLDALTIHKYSDDIIDVEHFASLWKERNLWRLKLIDLIDLGYPYRIIYTLEPATKRYHVLGIVNRDFNYDETDPRTQKIISAYDELGLNI